MLRISQMTLPHRKFVPNIIALKIWIFFSILMKSDTFVLLFRTRVYYQIIMLSWALCPGSRQDPLHLCWWSYKPNISLTSELKVPNNDTKHCRTFQSHIAVCFIQCTLYELLQAVLQRECDQSELNPLTLSPWIQKAKNVLIFIIKKFNYLTPGCRC